LNAEKMNVAELAFVLQVLHFAVVAVDAERDLRRQLYAAPASKCERLT
jgi:hypothetical protein